ncbi:hypothetical protein ABH994_002315 [Bradyrhizobium yuanmingense]|uniref:hypothetical protein n=1 Tax=Bradyrhizobium yuanmingense TaxID=108015 RepID=UPI0035127E3E
MADPSNWTVWLFGCQGRRCKSALYKRLKAIRSVLAGRSIFTFQGTSIKRGDIRSKYPPVGTCIYCGSSTYSAKPHVRKHPLGLEHIVAEGIGGTLELPEASCQDCEDATGRLVEGQVLGSTLKALRAHFNLKKPGSGRHPSTLPLSTRVNGIDRTVEIPTEDYPIIFNMLVYPAPDVANVNTEQGRAVIGAAVAVLKFDQFELFRKYGISTFSSAIWDNQMLTRLLAKIAHSYAFAELGEGKFSPRLLGLIRDGDISAMNLVGGDEALNDGRALSSALHELALGYQRINGAVYVVARIRLFASNGGPFYLVVVGESLETRTARAIRIVRHTLGMWANQRRLR